MISLCLGVSVVKKNSLSASASNMFAGCAKPPGKLWFGNAASLLSNRFTTSPAVSRNSAKTNSPRSPKSER